MPDDPHQQRLNGLEERQRNLLTKLARLQTDHDLETRTEEKLRLEYGIAETQATLQGVETELLNLKQQTLLSEANRLKRIGSIREAIGIWREIQRNDPASNIAVQEIAALEQLDSLQTQTSELIKRLASRVKDIRNIFKEVVAALKQPANTAEYMMLVEQAELLLDDVLDAETFIIWWEAVTAAPSQPATQNVDIAKLARRVQRGEMVLFLGSGIAYADDGVQEAALVRQLAQQIGYDKFNGTLSSIAEYYQLRPDFGQSALLANLRAQLPDKAQGVLLYLALARVQAPLILISAAYDNLLECVFHEAGKRFVELASIVRRSDEYDIGHVLVSFSDGSQPDKVYPEEELSRLRLLESGYSIIYKIRGTCGQPEDQDKDDLRRDALTLSESNFFSFARYADKMIPGYLARQLRNRGFLFVGYRPREWEDRLLASALLEKRNSQEPCYVIGETPEPLEAAYWESRNVKQYRVDIRELDRYLAEVAV